MNSATASEPNSLQCVPLWYARFESTVFFAFTLQNTNHETHKRNHKSDYYSPLRLGLGDPFNVKVRVDYKT